MHAYGVCVCVLAHGCACACVSVCTCMCHSTCMEIKGQPQESVLALRVVGDRAFSFTAAHCRLAGPQASGQSPVSTSHLTIRMRSSEEQLALLTTEPSLHADPVILCLELNTVATSHMCLLSSEECEHD